MLLREPHDADAASLKGGFPSQQQQKLKKSAMISEGGDTKPVIKKVRDASAVSM